MPNWVTGPLKIKGESKEVIRFITDILDIKSSDIFESNDKRFSWESDGPHIINGIDRCYADEFSISIPNQEERVTVIEIPFVNFAWKVPELSLAEIVKGYDVDIKYYGFESGNCFTHEIEILRGKIVKSRITNYKYNDYI